MDKFFNLIEYMLTNPNEGQALLVIVIVIGFVLFSITMSPFIALLEILIFLNRFNVFRIEQSYNKLISVIVVICYIVSLINKVLVLSDKLKLKEVLKKIYVINEEKLFYVYYDWNAFNKNYLSLPKESQQKLITEEKLLDLKLLQKRNTLDSLKTIFLGSILVCFLKAMYNIGTGN